MGLRQAVVREAVEPSALRVVAPSGESVSLAGEFLCLTRLRFDALLVEAAVNAGAVFAAPMSALQPIEDGGRRRGRTIPIAGGRVRGSRTVHAARHRRKRNRHEGVRPVRAAQAERGCRPRVLQGPGVAGGETPAPVDRVRAIAVPRLRLDFPGPGNRYNVGVGFFSDGRTETPSLRDLWERFTTRFGPAAEMVARSEALTEFRGAPLRTGLHGATSAGPDCWRWGMLRR